MGCVSVADHRKTAATAVRCFVLTISDTRTEATDTSGRAIAELLDAAGHVVTERALLRDEPRDVREAVARRLGTVDAIIMTGGTGITSRDSTYEAIASLLEKRLDGFGELFRVLSYEEIGSAAMLTRAAAGVARATAVFILPGSEHAVRLGMTRLIVPELGHIVRELRR
jgi:molybdenum cofactor biosynthesis protein B